MKRIKVIGIVGPSGSGKDTVAQSLMAHYPDKFHNIITTTTRPKRSYEINGVDYHFVSQEDFFKQELLEKTEFRGWYYGTSTESLDVNKVNMGVFNPSAIQQLYTLDTIDLIVIKLIVSDKTRLIRQLNREHNPDVNEIIRRYESDLKDFAEFDTHFVYGFRFFNETHQDLEFIIQAMDKILSNFLE